jgi:aryl-alcohol dehydrogenase-like predicted oxidoreductase
VPPDRKFPPDDHRSRSKFFSVDNRKRIMESLQQIQPIADRHRASLAQIVINWTAHVPGITAAIVGARNAEQAAHNAKAFSFELSAEEREQIRHAFDATSAKMMAEA